ncbi:carboxyl transferase domain-containing protein [Acidobacteriota bacterium]
MEKEFTEKKVDAFDKYRLVRKKERPRSRDLIPKIFDKFIPYNEGAPQDPNIIGGFAELDGLQLFVIGQNWRTVEGDNIRTTVTAKGFSHALAIMRLAEKYHKPVVTLIDTPGGDPLRDSAEFLQCWKISDCIYTLAGLKVPTVSIIIGEGGSGGALSLQVADRTFMLENAVFSVISPEGCARILFKGLSRKPRAERQERQREMAKLLKPTPKDMLEFGIIDGIIEEPGEGAHTNHSATGKNIKNVLKETLKELKKEPITILHAKRYQRFLSHGKWHEEQVEPEAPLMKNIGRLIAKRFKNIFKRKKKPLKKPEVDIIEKATEKIDKQEYVCKNKECGAKIPYKKYARNQKVCPQCGIIDRSNYPSAYEWIKYLVDRGSFDEKDAHIVPSDPINFRYTTDEGAVKAYKSDVERDTKKTGVTEALVTGTAKIKGKDVVVAVSEYGFRGGSLSSVVGEKFVRAVNHANELGCPLISVSMTGGARMQEGIYSLMQMAKTNMALTRRRVPYISIMADPTMAGSLSSYVTQADIHIAEANAEIGFAGTRVVEGYLKTRVRNKEGQSPDWYRPEFYIRRGGINEIVSRDNMRERVHEYLELFRKFRD